MATAKSSSRRLVPSAARIAATDMALPASVPPIPLTSIDGSSKSARTTAATAALSPYAAAGTPPPIGLPITSRSGSRPYAAVYPPGPAQIVWVSSISSNVPVSRVSRRSSSWNPGSGSTMPMLVSAGSASTQATSPPASAAASASTSLNGTTTVVADGSTGGPSDPWRGTTRPASSTTIVSSTVPW